MVVVEGGGWVVVELIRVMVSYSWYVGFMVC